MRSVFVGLTGFMGRIISESRVAFWAEDPSEHNFDSSRLIEIDLSLTPTAAAAQRISWDAVEVDDCVILPRGDLGGTTIRPRWPEFQMLGAVYVEQTRWQHFPDALRPAWPPKHAMGRPYEFSSVVYWSHIDDPRAGRRYVGHYAEIVQEQGSLARVSLFPAGTSHRAKAQPRTAWIDLSSPDQCDAGTNSLTEIGVGAAPKKGVLYLYTGTVDKTVSGLEGLRTLHDTDTDASEPLGMSLSHTLSFGDPKIPASSGLP